MALIQVQTIMHLTLRNEKDYYTFDIKTPSGIYEDLHFAFPGIINIENLTAAISIAMLCGVKEQEIRKAIILFQGVKRRFDIRINIPGLTYIDDYAHHPEEIRASIRLRKRVFQRQENYRYFSATPVFKDKRPC